MSDARSEILARIRSALVDVPADEDPSTQSIPRLYRHSAPCGHEADAETFVLALSHYGVQVSQARRFEVAIRAGEILARRNKRRIVVAADFPAEFEPDGVEVCRDLELSNAEIAAMDGAVTLSALGIAQTGTILLDHGTGQGRRVLSLLPDYQLCLIDAGQIVSLVPEAVERSTEALRAGRPLTFISGPSATSDIELIRVPGVHGPRTLDVLLVREPMNGAGAEESSPPAQPG